MKIKYIVALMTVIATAGGCTQDTGEQPEEAVPIRFAATIAPTDNGKTRAAGDWGERTTTLTQGTEFLNGEHVFVYIKENDGAHQSNIKWPIEYQVANDGDGDADDGDLNPVSDTTPFFFPVGVNTINIHAIHPSYTSGAGFTVQTDQTTEANYVASDLCYSKPTDYTRTGSGTDIDTNGRRILQFKHLLSKIVVNLTLDANVPGATLPTSIKLHAKTSTAMSYPEANANGYTGCTAPDASNLGIITMKQEAIIPPQEIAAGASFLSFYVTGVGPMIYPMPAATTFESGKMYTYNIRVKNVGIDVTTNVTDWGTKVDNQVVRARQVDYKLNPLWYVAKSNLNQDATSFSLVNSTSQGYLFTWATTMSMGYTYTTDGSSYDGYATPAIPKTVANGESGTTWHLPTRYEWASIFPFFTGNMLGTVPTANIVVDEEGSTFGYSNDTKYTNGIDNTSNTGKIYKSYWSATVDMTRYAIRFLDTEHCSVWKYQYLDHNTTSARLVVSARLIDPINSSNTSAIADMMTTITANDYVWSEDESKGAIQREFYACGYGYGGAMAAPAIRYPNDHILFWSSTLYSGNYIWRAGCNGSPLLLLNSSYSAVKTDGFSVRLFRDN